MGGSQLCVRLRGGLPEALTLGLGPGPRVRRSGGQLRRVVSGKRTTLDQDMEKQKRPVVQRHVEPIVFIPGGL